MTSLRTIIAAFLCAIALGLASAGLYGLPAFGHYPGPYGDIINRQGPAERHATNMVTLVNFDYRGFDTLGEEFILFAAVIGAVVLLREHRGEEASARPDQADEAPIPERSEAVAFGCRLALGITALFGIYVVLHAQLTPGGGFQGGAIVGSATALLYLGLGYPAWRGMMRSRVLDTAEAAGALAFIGAGLAAIGAGAPFLTNLLPLGTTGSIVSAGVIPLLNIAVGIAVAAGFGTLFLEYLEETREPESGGEQ
ncbi:MAG TPA: MnhB domain-containing protein [Stellaceae bacterium]|nr:MnhB domain-containing protein [Stellaceae bacterium]